MKKHTFLYIHMTIFLYALQYLKLILLVVGFEEGMTLLLLIREISLTPYVEAEYWNF